MNEQQERERLSQLIEFYFDALEWLRCGVSDVVAAHLPQDQPTTNFHVSRRLCEPSPFGHCAFDVYAPPMDCMFCGRRVGGR